MGLPLPTLQATIFACAENWVFILGSGRNIVIIFERGRGGLTDILSIENLGNQI